jgi:hypothetical protein
MVGIFTFISKRDIFLFFNKYKGEKNSCCCGKLCSDNEGTTQPIIKVLFYSNTNIFNLSLNFSKEKSLALISQSSLISIHLSGVKNLTALTISSTLASLSIKNQVVQSIIVSFNHHSFTHITGFHVAILSTGLIQKSSFTGI